MKALTKLWIFMLLLSSVNFVLSLAGSELYFKIFTTLVLGIGIVLALIDIMTTESVVV